MKNAKITIQCDENPNLLSIVIFISQDMNMGQFRLKPWNINSGDNKVMVSSKAVEALELFTGVNAKPRKDHVEGRVCYEMELPVSDDGKYLLIRNPIKGG